MPRLLYRLWPQPHRINTRTEKKADDFFYIKPDFHRLPGETAVKDTYRTAKTAVLPPMEVELKAGSLPPGEAAGAAGTDAQRTEETRIGQENK